MTRRRLALPALFCLLILAGGTAAPPSADSRQPQAWYRADLHFESVVTVIDEEIQQDSPESPRRFATEPHPTPVPRVKTVEKPRTPSRVKKTVPLATSQHSLSNAVATWYSYVPGGAAAGPALRSALGPHWRGTRIQVCAGSRCVAVVLSDWCACGGGHVVDLDVRSFAALAPTSRGVLRVTIRW